MALFYNSTYMELNSELKIGMTTLDSLLMITILMHTTFSLTGCLRSKDFQRSHIKLVFSLSLASFLMGLFLAYHAVGLWVRELNLSANKYFCLGQVMFYYLTYVSQICSLVFLVADRCLILRFPLHTKLISNRLSDVCTVLLWLYSIVLAVLPMVWLNVWETPRACFHHFVLNVAYIYLMFAHLLLFVVLMVVATIQIDYYMRVNMQAVLDLYNGDVDADKYVRYLKRTGQMSTGLIVVFFLSYFPYLLILTLQAGQLSHSSLGLLHFIFFYMTFLFPIISPLIILLMDPFLRNSAESYLLGMQSRRGVPSIHNNLTQDNPNYSKVFAKKVTALSSLNPKDSPHPVPLQGIFW